MSHQSLEEAIQSAGGAVELLRDLGVGRFTDLPTEFTHWIEEQRAWAESCALMDLSYHMTDFEARGPDAIELFSDLAVNNFDGFEPGEAKQLVVANPDGNYIGDAILFHLDDEEFLSVGAAPATNWLDYHAQTGDYDVDVEWRGRPVATDADPVYFRYQVQGPEAIPIVEEAIDGSLPEVGFFNFAEVAIDGTSVNALRHGMAGEPGFELFGPYEEGEAIAETLMTVGEDRGIRRVGAEAYQTPTIRLGWLPLPVPAIYDGESTKAFREWLPARRGILSIGGSFDSEDITDYYVTPVEMGYDHVIDLDGDFVGRDAIAAELENPRREKVTLVWNADDLTDAFGSLFTEGETAKFLEFPHPRWAACPYEEVRTDGELIGVSTDKGYIYNEREMLSLAIVDVDHAEPGTEVSLVLGEPADNTNPKVERHAQTEIRATVAPAPYAEDNR